VPHHAEVEEADDIAREDEEVSRMGVGMEKTVDEDLLEDQLRASTGNEGSVVPLGVEEIHVVDLDTLHMLQGQQAVRRGETKDPGNVNGVVVRNCWRSAPHGGLHVELISLRLVRANSSNDDVGR
jgi:hypothetical protein